MKNAEITEKIRKILKLAQDKGAHAGEIEAAMAKATEIARRHSIDLAQIDLTDPDEGPSKIEVHRDSSLKTRSVYKQPYHSYIFRVLHDVFDVEVLYNPLKTENGEMLMFIHIIGEPVDVAIAVAVFPYLEKIFPKTLSKKVSSGELSYNAADTNGCYWSIWHGIVGVNQREKSKLSREDQNNLALVVRSKEDAIKDHIEKEFPKLTVKKEKEKDFSFRAARHGELEGRKVNLRQLGGDSNLKIK